MTKRRAFSQSPVGRERDASAAFCARKKVVERETFKADSGVRRGISELGYLNWGRPVGRGVRSVNAALPYSRDRGVNSAYLSVRHGVLAFSCPGSGNDPFVRPE